MEAGGIGISNLPNQRYRMPFRRSVDYNIMAIGRNGLGKTTFLNMLLDTNAVTKVTLGESSHATRCTYVYDGRGFSAVPRDANSISKGIASFQKYVMRVTENGFMVNLTFTEVDHIGGSINNDMCWIPIEAYIRQQLALYREHERSNIKMNMRDPRIHACIFFIDPNPEGLGYLDICIMKRVSRLCNLIPVVAKSDTLSEGALEKCRENIQRALVDNDICVFNQNTEQKTEGMPPYFLVSFSKNHAGEYARKYPWGEIHHGLEEAWGFYDLRDILVKKYFCEILESTEILYTNFRVNELAIKHEADANGPNVRPQNGEGARTGIQDVGVSRG